MSLERKRAEVNLANIRAGRLANELKIDELHEAIERIKKDVQIAKDKEAEIEQSLSDKG
jgi:hypothetical protein